MASAERVVGERAETRRVGRAPGVAGQGTASRSSRRKHAAVDCRSRTGAQEKKSYVHPRSAFPPVRNRVHTGHSGKGVQPVPRASQPVPTAFSTCARLIGFGSRGWSWLALRSLAHSVHGGRPVSSCIPFHLSPLLASLTVLPSSILVLTLVAKNS